MLTYNAEFEKAKSYNEKAVQILEKMPLTPPSCSMRTSIPAAIIAIRQNAVRENSF